MPDEDIGDSVTWFDVLKAAPRRSTRGTPSRVSGRRPSTPIRRGRKKRRPRDEQTQDFGESTPLAELERFHSLPYEKKLGIDDARKGNWAEVEKIRQKYNEGTDEIIQRVAYDSNITSPIKEPWLSVIDKYLNRFTFGSGGWDSYKRKGFDRRSLATPKDKKNMELLIAITENLKGLDSDLYKPKKKPKMSRSLQYKKLKVPPSDGTGRGDEIHRLRNENTVLLGIHHRFNALMQKAGNIEHRNGGERSLWSIRAKPLSIDEFEGRPAGKIGAEDVFSVANGYESRFSSTVPRGLMENIDNVYRTYSRNKVKLEEFLNSPQNEMGIKLEELIIPE